MNSQEFVTVIKAVVRDAAVKGVVATLENPPGRSVPEKQRQRSTWFVSLDGEHRDIVEEIVGEAVDQAVFGLLAVIDGVRAIESGPDKGQLLLKYINDQEILLNDPSEPMLHDIYNASDL